MNKPRKLPVEGITVVDDIDLGLGSSKSYQSKTGKFIKHLDSILEGLSRGRPQVMFADKTIQDAMVVVFTPITGEVLRQLLTFADSWNLEIMIGRGVLGSIKIEFNLKEK